MRDSDGIHEEATEIAIRKILVVIRLSKERQEAVEAGFVKIAGTQKCEILCVIKTTLESEKDLSLTLPFGNGNAAKKIVDIMEKEFAV